MALSATPFLMFEGRAEEAMRFYLDAFNGSSITDLELYEEGEGGTVGTVKRASLLLAGQELRFFDSPVKHAFTFTPAFSIFVECEDSEELERAASLLSDGGGVLMPLDDYGFSKRFTWVNDRFGVSWQLNLA